MKNINAKYKLLALVPLFILSGCKGREHKNVIVDKVVNGTQRVWKLSDVESGKIRFFTYLRRAKGGSFYDYLEVGDTVSVVLVSGTLFPEKAYKQGFFKE